ncbi:MAG TPA: CinA family protein [Aquabacterium sp.]|uniref:CinA family protein n=1 Tax=Aquabacterium sp. TaxID=1872578 RepID=UPI002E372C4E|nr:CinA family protein [Aquabacterium sp.]HEX5354748.1 CinA family protein [Aquabacterium sp.]
MDTLQTLNLVQILADRLLARGWQMATAESCTGGLIAAACTELAGSSAWFDRGFVTYSNQAKTDQLGVDAALIAAHGAVSEAVARAMAEGALRQARVQLAVAVTGIAGPSGGSPDKPVGTVWLAWAVAGMPTRAVCALFEGDRAHIRAQTCDAALNGLIQAL